MEPIDEEAKETMRLLAEIIQTCIPDNFGFVMMIFDPKEHAQMNYISNCDRKDVVKMLYEFIEKTERGWAKDMDEGNFGVGSKHK